ncbi:metallophosphoesterase [Myroides sp. C15-4]|uniref:metallophosphoesterase n=1 Tax=Myroides sp. C15-4 TaxID=3400532 RepID=UPI003D2F6F20
MKRKYSRIGVLSFFFSTLSLQAQQYEATVQLDHAKSWSLVLVPDVQNYVKYYQNQPILDVMNQWISAHVEKLNIKMVLCVGDLVEQDQVILPGHDGDVPSKEQWEFVSRSFGLLNHKVPYILATGNHDYTIDQQGNRTSQYDDYFSIEQNVLNRKHIVQYGWDATNKPTLSNAVYEFTDLHGQDFLVLNVEYAPSDQTVAWANTILSFEEYKNHKVILLTHAYLNRTNERLDGENKWVIFEPYIKEKKQLKSSRIVLPDSNNGEQLWEKLVYPNQQIALVLAGHISGTGYRSDQNKAGRTVHQMLFDMQSEGGGHDGNGGDGLVRILEFYPDGKTVKVKTFSPLFALSPKTASLAYKKEQDHEYVFHLD